MRITDTTITRHLSLGGWITIDNEVWFYLDELQQLVMFVSSSGFNGLADISLDELESDEWKVLGNERTL